MKIATDGPRLCFRCVSARIPAERFGSWVWTFGDCRHGHFDVTVLEEEVEVVEFNTRAALEAASQVELKLDPDDGFDRA